MVPSTQTERRDGPLQAEIAHGVSDELRLQAHLALPMIATYLAELCMWYVDHAIVGRLGGVELAAVGLSGLFFWQLIVIGMAILAIVGVIVGNAHGAGDVSLVGRGVRQGLWIAVALSVPIMVLCWFLMDLLALTGQDPRIIAIGEEYVRASVWVIPPSLGFVALRSFVVGVSRPLVITVLVSLTLPLNFLLSYGLVFGELGMPQLGVAGAGYATSVVGWLMFIALIVYIGRHATLRQYQNLSWSLVVRRGPLAPNLAARLAGGGYDGRRGLSVPGDDVAGRPVRCSDPGRAPGGGERGIARLHGRARPRRGGDGTGCAGDGGGSTQGGAARRLDSDCRVARYLAWGPRWSCCRRPRSWPACFWI